MGCQDIIPGLPVLLQEQLDSIHHFYTTYFSDSSLKGFLYDRNIVMAHQMDSLMKQQTMFTAIGAGPFTGKRRGDLFVAQ
jgi:uncharacterized protein YbaP (TraB family)